MPGRCSLPHSLRSPPCLHMHTCSKRIDTTNSKKWLLWDYSRYIRGVAVINSQPIASMWTKICCGYWITGPRLLIRYVARGSGKWFPTAEAWIAIQTYVALNVEYTYILTRKTSKNISKETLWTLNNFIPCSDLISIPSLQLVSIHNPHILYIHKHYKHLKTVPKDGTSLAAYIHVDLDTQPLLPVGPLQFTPPVPKVVPVAAQTLAGACESEICCVGNPAQIVAKEKMH